jgi:hypothetical protein
MDAHEHEWAYWKGGSSLLTDGRIDLWEFYKCSCGAVRERAVYLERDALAWETRLVCGNAHVPPDPFAFDPEQEGALSSFEGMPLLQEMVVQLQAVTKGEIAFLKYRKNSISGYKLYADGCFTGKGLVTEDGEGLEEHLRHLQAAGALEAYQSHFVDCVGRLYGFEGDA